MDRNKTLYQLGVEYEQAAKVVKSRIAAKRLQLRSLRDSICSNEAYVLKSEISMLYSEYREAMEIARHLKSYYSGEDEKTFGGAVA